MRRFFVLISILSILMACRPGSGQKLKNGALKHIVLIDLKESCSSAEQEMIIDKLLTLGEIKEVLDLEVSRRINTDDVRALENYDLMLYTEFADIKGLNAYASNPEHLRVREEIKAYLAAVPVVLDTQE